LKQRNFDPETRTLRKRDPTDALEDTVEKNVEGVAEQIIAEDAERRQQELVCTGWDSHNEHSRNIGVLGSTKHSTKTTELGSEARDAEEVSETRSKKHRSNPHAHPYVISFWFALSQI
jgi:cwf18 pre-mRNA splicing factor